MNRKCWWWWFQWISHGYPIILMYICLEMCSWTKSYILTTKKYWWQYISDFCCLSLISITPDPTHRGDELRITICEFRFLFLVRRIQLRTNSDYEFDFWQILGPIWTCFTSLVCYCFFINWLNNLWKIRICNLGICCLQFMPHFFSCFKWVALFGN